MAIATLERPATHSLRPVFRPLRALGVRIGAALDGLTVGLVAGYVLLAALGGPGSFLGIPDPAAVALIGLGTGLLAASGALLAIGARRVVGAACSRLRRALAGRHPWLATLVGVPSAILGGVPVGWLGALAVLLALALVGRTAFVPLALLAPPAGLVPFVYLSGVIGAVLGVARTWLRPRSDGRMPGRASRAAGLALVGLSGLAVIAGSALAWWPGTLDGVVAHRPAFDGLPIPTDLDDPGQPGPFGVETLSYGSGTDARRPAFGADADLTTASVDADALLDPLAPGADLARRWFWGFGPEALPIQGLAWLPVGEGPFPLVLIVHGNHAMGDFSEPGYAYLGEHLASRGFVTVSVDEDFLNGSWADDHHGNEQLVRAWLLLLHLDAWRTWSVSDEGPLAGRVDLDRVALIGHSRGGEAASAAAVLASADRPPRAGMTPWPEGLDVDAVVAIAPSDGQYTGSLRLDGVDFLTLQGGWDADARAWSGIRQYARTTPSGDGFAAGLWVYRANHGQFNTEWGATDFGPYSRTVLDLAPLLSGEEQRDVARTAIGAFLEASLHGTDGYRGLFRRPMVGREWLPPDVVIARSRLGAAVPLWGADPAHPADGVRAAVDGAVARDLPIPLRALQREQAMRGTFLRWTAASGDATWRLTGLDAVPAPSSGGWAAIRVAIADGRDPSTSDERSIPVSVRAEAGGVAVGLPLDRFGALPPPLPVHLVKHDLLMTTAGMDVSVWSRAEVVLQTYEVPLRAFTELDPAFDPTALTGVALTVPRATDGALWIAEPALLP